MKRVRLTGTAVNDLTEIWAYVAVEQESVLNANALIDSFDAHFQLLATQPEAGEAVDHLRPETRRSIVRRRYLVFYEFDDVEIRILRVLHGSRLIRPEELD